MIFDPIRDRVRNVTEVGIHFGKSLRVWHAYFRHASIYGIDIAVQPQAWQTAKELGERVRVMPPADSTDETSRESERGLIERLAILVSQYFSHRLLLRTRGASHLYT